MNQKSEIPPTVGRVLWYWPNGMPHSGIIQDPSQPFRADICYVWPDGRVNLNVCCHNATRFERHQVPIVPTASEETPPQGTPYATWMPFQIGQAKAAERGPQAEQIPLTPPPPAKEPIVRQDLQASAAEDPGHKNDTPAVADTDDDQGGNN